MLRACLISVAIFAALAGSCQAADWLSVYNKDEFDGKDRYLAISSLAEPNFIFVCEAETAKLRMLFKTAVKTTRSIRDRLPIWPVKLAVIVDDQPVRSYSGQVAGIDKKLVFDSSDEKVREFGNIVSSAHRRILVAVDAFGEKSFRHEFSVVGSGKAIAKVIAACDAAKKKMR